MFGIGETELVIIVVFAFLLFGPDKMPGMGRTLGRMLRQFREASDGFTEVVQTNIMDPASEELEKSPKQRSREAAARLEEDTDLETAQPQEEAAPAPRRETFAERKARLAAEREARLAEQGAQAETFPADEDESVAGADSDEDLDDTPQAPARTTAADLYAASSARKSSRSRAREAAEQESAEEPATSAAPESGEEEGNA